MGQKKEKEEKKLKRRNKWESTEKEENKNEDGRQRGEKRLGVEESGYVCGGERK